MNEHELGACLRSWRDRLDPAEIGLQPGPGRRTPGLRREEVAQLAGLSLDYLARLEQGRARNPSASVVAPLARALRLTDEERDHLYRLAGHAPPMAGRIDRHVTPSVQRVLDRLGDVPVVVLDAAWTVVAQNALAAALLGAVAATDPPRERNIIWRHFTGRPSRVVRTPEDDAAFEAQAVADLHEALGRHPEDPTLRALIDDLRSTSPRFDALWDRRPVARLAADRKAVEHPEIGRLTLDCDTLTVAGSDLRIVIYTAPAGSPEADALVLLAAIGTQTFTPR